jgi:hypothetical protein
VDSFLECANMDWMDAFGSVLDKTAGEAAIIGEI